METEEQELYTHPANAVFALMDDREFRYSLIRPALEKDKASVCRLTSGKHQLKGFRHLGLAPNVMIVPVLSDEASITPALAHRLLELWLEANAPLQERVAAKLTELGYTLNAAPFTEDNEVSWRPMSKEHAQLQYDGAFLADEDKNRVMLMSLLLGSFGGDEDESEGEATDDAKS